MWSSRLEGREPDDSPTTSFDDTAFPALNDAQLAFLEGIGERHVLRVGEYLYRAGDVDYDFFALVSGRVDIVLDGSDGEEPVISHHGPGRFLGELNLLTGQRVYLSARVAESGEAIRVPAPVFRRVIVTNVVLGDTILTAFMARRDLLLSGAASSLRMIGSRYMAETQALREFLVRSRIPHEWLDPERDASVERLVQSLGFAGDDLPIVISSRKVLRNATSGLIADHLGLTVDRLPERTFDLVIVGSGPAGLAASVYGASEGLRTLTVDRLGPGGQAGASSRIENYLGFPTGISGRDLAQRSLVQAEKFGARLSSPCPATSLREKDGHLVVGLGDGTEVVGRAVIAATGASYRRLPVDDLTRFERRGVYYAATEEEARACGSEPVIVVGGGNAAGQAAVFLGENGNDVTIVVRSDDLRAGMSRYLVDRIEAHPKITVRTGCTIAGFVGDERLRAVHVKAPAGNSTVLCVALFSFIGAEPATEWLSGCAALDGHAFVLTDRMLDEHHLQGPWALLGRRPLPYETSHPGLFAVGDVRSCSTKRVAAAVGEGSAAVRSVHEYLAFAH